jgi:tRNA G18 (ribose-2'-O)-methylase SpoU
MQKLSHSQLVERQQNLQLKPKLPFSVVLNNIRSLYNVGSLFRTADGVGLEKLWLCGITGIPPDPQIAKTALGAEKNVLWEYRERARPLIEEFRQNGYQIVLLEQTLQSIPYQEFYPVKPVCLIVGNEIQGVSEELAGLSDIAIEIPMRGIKNSLNVSVAFGVVAYHIGHVLASIR